MSESVAVDLDTKSLLSDFYGALLDEDTENGDDMSHNDENGDGDDFDGDISSYYNVDDENDERGGHGGGSRHSHKSTHKVKVVVNELDKDDFDADTWTEDLLRTSHLNELLSTDATLLAEKRSLDSDMQMLVYENYNKFISATDMIRKMKSNVESMEEEMNVLSSSMEKIAFKSREIEDKLAPSRGKVDHLVGVSRLLKRLEFLFELPAKLRSAIDIGAYAQAVKYFRVSVKILSQYSHLKSFEAIKKESELIIVSLKDKLRSTIVKDPSNPSKTSPNILEQLTNTAMLIDLGEPPLPLIGDLLRLKLEALDTEITKCEEHHAAALKRTTQYNIQHHLDDEDSNEEALESSDLIDMLSKKFLNPFLHFASSYVELLIHPLEVQIAASKKKNEDKIETVENCRQSLIQFTAQLYQHYLSISRKELLRRGTLHHHQPYHPMSFATRQAQITNFTKTLGLFWDGIQSIHKVIPAGPANVTMVEQAVQLIEHVIRQSVDCWFDQTLSNVIDILVQMHTTVSDFQTKTTNRIERSYSKSSAHDLEETEISHNDDENNNNDESDPNDADRSAHHNQNETTADEKIISPASYATSIRTCLDEGLQLLVPLLNTKSYLANSSHLNFSFNELAYSQFYQLCNSVSTLLMCRVLRASEGPIFDPPSKPFPPPLQNLPAIKSLTLPFFYLYLSQISVAFETAEFKACLRTLKKCFPVAVKTFTESSWLTLMARIKESGQLLLQRYVELHGLKMTKRISELCEELMVKVASSTQSPMAEYIQQAIANIEVELSQVLPVTKKDRKHTDSSSSTNNHSLNSPMGNAGAFGSNMNMNMFGGLMSSTSNLNSFGNFSSRERLVNREIARLFSTKVRTYGPVQMNDTDPIVSVLKIVFKAWIEDLRSGQVSSSYLSQLETDLAAIKENFPESLQLAHIREDDKVIYALMDEVGNSAIERSTE